MDLAALRTEMYGNLEALRMQKLYGNLAALRRTAKLYRDPAALGKLAAFARGAVFSSDDGDR